MPDTLQSNADSLERRTHWRQRVLLSHIELDEDNGGIILNISSGGLALQAVDEINDDELPKIRFQLSQSERWVKATGRVAWRSESKKTVGVQFIDLPDEARKEIRAWIAGFVPAPINRSIPQAGSESPVGSETETVGTGSADTGAERARVAVAENVRQGSRKAHIALLLALATLLASAALLLAYHFGRTEQSPPRTELADHAKVPVNPAPATNSKPPSDRTAFALQAGVMRREKNAVTLAESLQQRGFPAFVFQTKDDDFYRVFVGPYSDADSMIRVREELNRGGFQAIPAKWPPVAK